MLDVSENRFSCEITLENLPPTMEGLWMQENKLVGNVTFANLPKGLDSLDITRNRFLEIQDPPIWVDV